MIILLSGQCGNESSASAGQMLLVVFGAHVRVAPTRVPLRLSCEMSETLMRNACPTEK